MTNYPFYIVDVFAEEKYAGNQLAVIRNAAVIPSETKQLIARETNFSETTFILSDEGRDGGYDVRIFTPTTEIPFAGHPTLGTAYIIQREIIRESVETVTLNLSVGQIPVSFTYEDGEPSDLWMKQVQPTFGANLDIDASARLLGIDTTDIDDRFPVQEVSTGIPFVIAPVNTFDAVVRATVSTDKYREIDDFDAKGVMAFCAEPVDSANHIHARVFAHGYGVPEDPATGSANGCLAAYLCKHRYFGGDKLDVRVEQGYQIGRPSLLLLRSEKTESGIDVYVGGKVIMVARAELV
ncbi:MAG: PhzF family phenazine biosynthesis protein [bacterium]|nr:PhzF family phenazine biosynthesis protein [bacterium]